MWFKDTLNGRIVTLKELHDDWVWLYSEDPENTPVSFLEYMLNVIEATVNCRNDLEFVNTPPKTIGGIVRRLVDRIHPYNGW